MSINTDIPLEKINQILYKSPLTILKEEFEWVSQQILLFKLHTYVMPLLRIKEYYLFFDIPYSIKLNIDILASFDEERSNFFEIIGYVKFKYGTESSLLMNLILFKYKQFLRLKQQNREKLHKVIGEILSSLWWHYEIFKQNAQLIYTEEFRQMEYAIICQQQNQDQFQVLKYLSQQSKYIKLIISNSIIDITTIDRISEETDNFIQQILKIDIVTYQYLNQFSQISSYFSLKYRVIYQKLLYYYWLIAYQSMNNIQNQEELQFNSSSQNLISSRISSNSKLISSRISSNSQLLYQDKIEFIMKPKIQLKNYLQANIQQFSKSIMDQKLIEIFCYNDNEQDDLINQLNCFECLNDIKMILQQNNTYLKSLLQHVNIDKLLFKFNQNKKYLKLFNILLKQSSNLITHIEHIQQINQIDYMQNKYDALTIYFNNNILKIQDDSHEIINLISYKLNFSSKETKLFHQLFFQYNEQFEIKLLITILKLQNINSIDQIIMNQQFLQNISNQNWQIIGQIISQKTLINIFYIILQTITEQEQFNITFSFVLSQILQIINKNYEEDLILYFFKFFNNHLQIHQIISLIQQNQTQSITDTVFENTSKLLMFALNVESQQQKETILYSFKLIFQSYEQYSIDLILNNLQFQCKSLLLFIQIIFYKQRENETNFTLLLDQLYTFDSKFYEQIIPKDWKQNTTNIIQSNVQLVKQVKSRSKNRKLT